jgi:hypothetical protein
MRDRSHLPTSHRHAFLIALAAPVCALALAACGGSSNTSQANATKGFSQAVKFSDCMRSHGVTNFPDPTTGGGGGFNIRINAGSGVDPQSPSFQSAQDACHSLLPGGGPGGGHPTEQDKLSMLHLSQCMRANGLTDFPDPTTTQPSVNPGSGQPSLMLGRDGVFLALPPSISTQSPAFIQAARKCGFPIPPGAR